MAILALVVLTMTLQTAAGVASNLNCPANGILKASIPGYNEPMITMVDVHAHLLGCRDTIEHLDLRIYLSGCSEWPDRYNLPFPYAGGNDSSSEQQQGNSSSSYYYPALKSLKLEGYEFEQSDWADIQPWKWGYSWWLRSGKLFPWWGLWRSASLERLRMSNLDLWLEAMDWGALERLEFVAGVPAYFVDMGARHLTSLKDLTIGAGRDGPRNATTRLFTTALPPEVRLERLAWVDNCWDHAALEPILDRHGPSLRRLEIWSYEPEYPTRCDSDVVALDVSQIQRISAGAPNLEHLALKVHRTGEDDAWPLEAFEAVAAIPQLASAEVWLDLAADCMRGVSADPYAYGKKAPRCKAGQEYRLPMLNLTSASNIFSFLREKKRELGHVELERVTFRAGDWYRPWDGPIYEPSWLEGRWTGVECSIFREDGSRAETLEDMCRLLTEKEWGARWGFDDYDRLGLDLIEDLEQVTFAAMAEEQHDTLGQQEALRQQGELTKHHEQRLLELQHQAQMEL